MTDEEKEAFEYFRKREEICMENADICDENNFDEEATCLRKEHILIETLLNLIEKQDKMIKEAYAKANNYLYFADSADYEVALWEVIRSLRPDLAKKWDNGDYDKLEYIKEKE